MEVKEVCDQDMLVDLEKGNCLLPKEDNSVMMVNSISGHARTKRHSSWDVLVALKDDKSHHISCCSSQCRDSTVKSGDPMTSEGEIKVGLLDKSAADKEKKKWYKKPPRPPRPPTTSPLDPTDQKLISELSELAVLKRARIERMKALKKTKNSKPASSIGNLVALFITVIFCLFILWQALAVHSSKSSLLLLRHPLRARNFLLNHHYIMTGVHCRLADEIKHWVSSRHGVSISFDRPSISSVRMHGGLISIQFYKKNVAAISPHSSPAAPNNTGVATRLEIHGETRSVTE